MKKNLLMIILLSFVLIGCTKISDTTTTTKSETTTIDQTTTDTEIHSTATETSTTTTTETSTTTTEEQVEVINEVHFTYESTDFTSYDALTKASDNGGFKLSGEGSLTTKHVSIDNSQNFMAYFNVSLNGTAELGLIDIDGNYVKIKSFSNGEQTFNIIDEIINQDQLFFVDNGGIVDLQIVLKVNGDLTINEGYLTYNFVLSGDYNPTLDEVEQFFKPIASPGGRLEINDDNFKVITASGDTWGGMRTPTIKIDFNENPKLTINSLDVTGQWAIKFKPVDDKDFYVLKDTSLADFKTFDLKTALIENAENDTDKNKVLDLFDEEVDGEFWILAAGGEGNSVSFKEFSLLYDDAYYGNYAPSKFETTNTFINQDHANITYDVNNNAVITPDNDSWGKVASPVIYLDFSKNIQVQIAAAVNNGGKWALEIIRQDGQPQNSTNLIGENTDTNLKTYTKADIVARLGNDVLDQVVPVKLVVTVAGGTDAQVILSEIKAIEAVSSGLTGDYNPTAEEMVQDFKNEDHGQAVLENGEVTIKPINDTWGKVATPDINLDFSKDFEVNIDLTLNDPNVRWGLQIIRLDGTIHDTSLRGEETPSGLDYSMTFTKDDVLARVGTQLNGTNCDVKFVIIISSASSTTYYTLNDFSVIYK